MNGRGWAPPDVSCRSSEQATTLLIRIQMDMHFELLHVDLLLPNIPIREMYADFRALQQISLSKENRASDLPRRALKAANELVNSFIRVDGDEEDPDLLLPVIDKCRKIAWEILGSLSESDKANLAPSDPKVQEGAKIWAIGHWYVHLAPLEGFTMRADSIPQPH
jgi:hypothetical protein